MIGVADVPQGSNYDICRIKKSSGKWKSWEKISTSPATRLAGDSSLIFLSQSARGSNERQRQKTKPTWWGFVNQRSWLESLPFSTAAMLEQLSQAPEHLLFFLPPGSRITMNKFCHNRANMELGAKEGSALYPERFQAQQSQTHSLHSCILHVHVGHEQTHSLTRPAADVGIIF